MIQSVMSKQQRKILAYCAKKERTFEDLIRRFRLSSDEYEFYRSVFGDHLESYYDLDLSRRPWEKTTIRASEKGIAYVESVYLEETRWNKTHRIAVAAIIISIISLIVSIKVYLSR